MSAHRPEGPTSNRRQFLTRTSFALASVGIAGFPARATAGPLETSPVADRGAIQRTLGRTGLTLPIVGMGVMNANNPDLVKQAYEAGVRLFDTALRYQQGRNEQMVGDVISRLGVRDKVVIQTKVPFPGVPAGEIKAKFLADFAGCLERLQTSYVDILLIHQPSVEQMENAEARAALTELKQQKKARFVGISSHRNQADVLRSAAKDGFYDVAVIGFNITNASDADYLAAIKTAASKGVGLIAMKTQAGGRGRNLGTLNHTAMLKWVMQHAEMATSIPGYTNADQLAESLSVVSGLEFTADEKAWLADKRVMASIDFCKQCGSCLPTCPSGVDIPTLMRTHMYAANYANFEQARATFDEIPAHASLGNCVDCARCSARCANTVQIAERVGDLKAMYA